MNAKSKGSTIKQAILWGIISLLAYLIIFSNEQTINDYFSRGGHFAVLVIATAFLFSFIHGAFANYLVEAMGFKAISKAKGGH